MTSEPSTPPFSGLHPDCILDAVESVGLHSDGRVLALNSYENRVYRIGLEDHPAIVAKFYRPDRWSDAAILEEHQFSQELVSADLPVVPPQVHDGRTLHRHAGFRFALFKLQGGHAPEPGDRDCLRQIGRTLGRLHAVGARAAFQHRSTLGVKSHAIEPIAYLLDANWLPNGLDENFEAICDLVIDEIEDAWSQANPVATFRLHGDCHLGNLLWRDDGIHLVDLDDALTGPAIADLWMLCTGERDERSQQLAWLLEGYELFNAFNRRELILIEALRAMRLLNYHAWIARRWGDPAFPAAFPEFAAPRHWEGVIGQLQEQLAVLREPTLTLP